MPSWSQLLSVAHVVGIALGVGAATVKVAMVLRCNADPAFARVYLSVAKFMTRQIILGMIVMTLSGIGWLLLGYPFSALLVVKLVLVAAMWVMGPVIDNAVEPRFARLAPAAGEGASAEFIAARTRYVTLEIVATLVFYVIIVLWMLR
jgi:hypothetical protein